MLFLFLKAFYLWSVEAIETCTLCGPIDLHCTVCRNRFIMTYVYKHTWLTLQLSGDFPIRSKLRVYNNKQYPTNTCVFGQRLEGHRKFAIWKVLFDLTCWVIDKNMILIGFFVKNYDCLPKLCGPEENGNPEKITVKTSPLDPLFF